MAGSILLKDLEESIEQFESATLSHAETQGIAERGLAVITRLEECSCSPDCSDLNYISLGHIWTEVRQVEELFSSEQKNDPKKIGDAIQTLKKDCTKLHTLIEEQIISDVSQIPAIIQNRLNKFKRLSGTGGYDTSSAMEERKQFAKLTDEMVEHWNAWAEEQSNEENKKVGEALASDLMRLGSECLDGHILPETLTLVKEQCKKLEQQCNAVFSKSVATLTQAMNTLLQGVGRDGDIQLPVQEGRRLKQRLTDIHNQLSEVDFHNPNQLSLIEYIHEFLVTLNAAKSLERSQFLQISKKAIEGCLRECKAAAEIATKGHGYNAVADLRV